MGDYQVRTMAHKMDSRHPCRNLSANPFADQGAHCRPWTPASPDFSPPLLKKGGLLWHKLFCRNEQRHK